MKNNTRLQKAANKFMDIAEEFKVDILPMSLGKTGDGRDRVGLGIADREGEGEIIPFQDIKRDPEYRSDLPPENWEEFLEIQTEEFIRKDTDYRHKYTRGLLKHGKIIWEWEVEKKLDRIRTWIDRGELTVKGEGLNNAVGDLFNYTVLYEMYKDAEDREEALEMLNKATFKWYANAFEPAEWVDMLVKAGLIDPDETMVKGVIFKFMGVADLKA